ncbi:hypothetical protein TCCBUS3UF1_12490 [Thermus sp. CCB_US3_UF1]|uniref:hypothetical protein n=1 Tax=Thermus sp. CCB_US3_UF1 TaxID=1111069 RepID=UPI000238A3E4|nr:hypothetical protein [Thermus sp. CCB_US3_UF1]AEV16292.1 hypothetical protein TCCBUS3UF1_12490 [Thermus sp. CCB_US3_UF1]
MVRGLALLALFLPALAQGYEVGLWGLGGLGGAYLRLQGELALPGGRLGFALAPYGRAPGEVGLALERLVLVGEEGEWALALGRLPLTLGEGRLFPYTWNRPSPAGGEEGVWGGYLTGYGEARLRLGWVMERGPFLEVALPELRAYAFPGGGGLGWSLRAGPGVAYGEARWEAGQGVGLLGVSLPLEEGVLTLEATYPWAWAGAWWGSLEGWRLGLLAGYRGGWFAALEGEWEGWGFGVAWPGLGWRVSFRGDF